MMKIDSLEKLFIHELKDLHSAERQILEALPKMRDAASRDELKEAFAGHLEESRGHVSRLEEVFAMTDFQPGGEHCVGCEGLIEEGAKMIQSIERGDVLDAALITAAQRVEHYEIAGYGGAIAFAKKLGHQEIAEILTKTLEEEGKTDRLLTRIAEKSVNFRARMAS